MLSLMDHFAESLEKQLFHTIPESGLLMNFHHRFHHWLDSQAEICQWVLFRLQFGENNLEKEKLLCCNNN